MNAWLSSSSGDIYGGGVQATAGTIQNCLIASNSANTAGGVFLNGSKVLVEDCTIVSNYARSFIGGAFVKFGTIRNSVIRGNRGSCGGMQVGDWIFANGYAYNCLVISNYVGVGAEIRGNDSRIWNCTIVSNLNGGARFARAYEGQIYNSIVYDNTGGDFTGAAGTVTHSCASAFLYSDPSNITNPPSFVNPAGGNYRLNVNSPCINAGMNQSWMTNAYDLEGGQRIRYGTVDMGAYERVYEGSVYNFY